MTKQEIREICKRYNIYDYVINEDMSVDIKSNLSLEDNFTDFCGRHLPLNFNNILFSFNISGNNNLETLKGSPKYCGGFFACRECRNLKSLKYSPKKCEEYFCYSCESLKNLDYMTLKCFFRHDDFDKFVVDGLSMSNFQTDKYLLRRIMLGDYKYTDKLRTRKAKEKIKPLIVMRDFDLL